jgi:hypothetical protein
MRSRTSQVFLNRHNYDVRIVSENRAETSLAASKQIGPSYYKQFLNMKEIL